jgi:hypothetical protein
MLRTCRADLIDIAEVHRMNQLITQHDFPRYIEIEPDNPDDPTSDPPVVDDHYNYWHDYLSTSPIEEGGISGSYIPPG